jgi:hypothetical protein
MFLFYICYTVQWTKIFTTGTKSSLYQNQLPYVPYIMYFQMQDLSSLAQKYWTCVHFSTWNAHGLFPVAVLPHETGKRLINLMGLFRWIFMTFRPSDSQVWKAFLSLQNKMKMWLLTLVYILLWIGLARPEHYFTKEEFMVFHLWTIISLCNVIDPVLLCSPLSLDN